MTAVPSFAVSARSDAPVDAVFAVLSDIPRWQEWAGPAVRQSVRATDGHPEPDGVGAVRRLGSGRLSTREEVVEFDRPHHLAYVLRSGLPLRGYRADVDLAEAPGGGTAISWRGSFEPSVPGTGGAFRWFLGRTVAGFARRLAAEAVRVGGTA